jgi:hypothetical protein
MLPDGLRDRFLRAAVVWGVAVCVITELLGWLQILNRTSLAIAWVALALTAVAAVYRSRTRIAPVASWKFDAVVWLSVAGVVVLLCLTFATAILSPPNSADAMAYHMPRVVYWAEQSSVRFFPTPYLNQIMLQPMAEYIMLHTYLLSGGDRFINLIAWFASLGCIVAVSGIARLLGAGARGQALAALFCATLPGGILASSGAKNDYLLALWLAAMAYFALRFAATLRTGDALLFGCALGLALLTKATGYLFAPFLLATILAPKAIGMWKPMARGFALAALCAVAINTPQYTRNIALSGSPLGFDSAQGNGYYRWHNETFGWKQTLSNFLRNASEQTGARSNGWNREVFDFVQAVHRELGIDIGDPATTWRGSVFAPPVNANHEANAPNRWHLAILCVIAAVLLWRALQGKERTRFLYALSLFCGFLAFCAYLKWQPFMTRLVLPLFVLGAPLASMLEEIRPVWIQVVAYLFLLNNARLSALENWVRPLKGPNSIVRRNRDDMYFSDMGQWNNAAAYPLAVQALRPSGCGLVGIDINNLQLEYPLQALLRESAPNVRFVHTGVDNVSRRYRQPAAGVPCAIACLDCLNDPTRLELYRDFPTRVAVGKFVILLR